jgi:BASS family bile acid:Na+ symporter
MPVAMVVGGLLHRQLGGLGFLTPWFLFGMLFIPFCGVRLGELRVSGLHMALLAFQAIASVSIYAALRRWDVDVAQGAMICLLAPTANAAMVIASMLGARISTMLSYSLVVNFAVALGAPLFFSIVAPSGGLSLGESFVNILGRVIPVLVLPFVAALVLQKVAPRAAALIERHRSMSFYLWIVALTIVTARVVNFVAEQENLTPGKGLALAGTALVCCAGQFLAGRAMGRRFGETVAGGQALGQKNTILAIWLAQSYLNPVSSIAPAAYVLWQTIINSTQLYLKSRREANVE